MKKIIVILILFMLLPACNRKKGIDVQETRQHCKAEAIMLDQLVDLLYSGDLKDVQFIDARTPHDYAVSHLPGAVNIPAKNFFNDAYWQKVDKDKVLIIYGYDASSPQLLTLMAGHFNKARLYVALGGYDYIEQKIMNGTGMYSGLYNDEEPLVDYQEKINEIRSRSGGGAAKPVKKPAAAKPVIKKRKKKEVTGGCG